jgi:hypothetical protein
VVVDLRRGTNRTTTSRGSEQHYSPQAVRRTPTRCSGWDSQQNTCAVHVSSADNRRRKWHAWTETTQHSRLHNFTSQSTMVATKIQINISEQTPDLVDTFLGNMHANIGALDLAWQAVGVYEEGLTWFCYSPVMF